MFVPSTFAVALLMTILSTICWGSFANTFKVTKNYRFELYYWDYALGIFLIAVLLALTMGSFAGGPTAFLAEPARCRRPEPLLRRGRRIHLQHCERAADCGHRIVGLAVAFPLSIGIALAEGAILAYALQPKGNPVLLGIGVLMSLVAVILVGKAYGALRTGAETSRARASSSA